MWEAKKETHIVTNDSRRITVVSRHPRMQERKWDRSHDGLSRIVLLDSFAMLRHAVCSSLAEAEADVERIVLDRSTSASDYLALLADLPHAFTGDVLMNRDDETGFLSANGRGGDRILYALSADDVRFYLETHKLVVPGAAHVEPVRQIRVLQFRSRVAVA